MSKAGDRWIPILIPKRAVQMIIPPQLGILVGCMVTGDKVFFFRFQYILQSTHFWMTLGYDWNKKNGDLKPFVCFNSEQIFIWNSALGTQTIAI